MYFLLTDFCCCFSQFFALKTMIAFFFCQLLCKTVEDYAQLLQMIHSHRLHEVCVLHDNIAALVGISSCTGNKHLWDVNIFIRIITDNIEIKTHIFRRYLRLSLNYYATIPILLYAIFFTIVLRKLSVVEK